VSELKFLGYNNQGGFVEVVGGWDNSLELFYLNLVDLKREVLFDSLVNTAEGCMDCTPKLRPLSIIVA
jgi:hypothetical protein